MTPHQKYVDHCEEELQHMLFPMENREIVVKFIARLIDAKIELALENVRARLEMATVDR